MVTFMYQLLWLISDNVWRKIGPNCIYYLVTLTISKSLAENSFLFRTIQSHWRLIFYRFGPLLDYLKLHFLYLWMIFCLLRSCTTIDSVTCYNIQIWCSMKKKEMGELKHSLSFSFFISISPFLCCQRQSQR